MKKKTRQRVYRPVSRKGKQTQRQYRDLKKQLRDATLRKRWRNRCSLQENMLQFSLKDFEDRLADDDQLKQQRPPKPLNERELVLLHELQKKHCNDLQAMVRDKKLNVYQWTAAQCEKLLQLYKQQHVCASAKKYLLPCLAPSPATPSAATTSAATAVAPPAKTSAATAVGPPAKTSAAAAASPATTSSPAAAAGASRRRVARGRRARRPPPATA